MKVRIEKDELGFKEIPQEAYYGIQTLRSKENFDIVVANGQNALKDKIFRMGTLGFVCDRDLISAVGALEATLYKLGHKFELGSGVAAVIKELV